MGKKEWIFPHGRKEQAGRQFSWAEARRQEILCNVTMSISSCVSAIGIINLIMVVSVCVPATSWCVQARMCIPVLVAMVLVIILIKTVPCNLEVCCHLECLIWA